MIMEGGAPPPPVANLPAPDVGMHNLTRNQPAARQQIKEFFTTGQIINKSNGACVCQTGACGVNGSAVSPPVPAPPGSPRAKP